MNELQENIREKRKAIAYVTLLIFCICVGFSAYILQHGQKVIDEKIALQEQDIRSLAKVVEKAHTEKYKTRIKSFLNIKTAPVKEKMLKALARRDRQELLRITTPFYEIFRKENKYFSTFAWFLPDNTVFLRVPKPHLFGDDISLVRPDIVAANRNPKQNFGYLAAYSGLDYRIVQPVTYKGQHLGVLQFGLKDDYLINTIKKQLNIPVIQVLPTKKFEIIKFSKLPSQNSGSYTIQSHDLDLIRSAESPIDWSLARQRVILGGKDHIINRIIELPNYAGEQEGCIFALLDISEHTAGMRADIIKIVLVSLVLVLLSYFFISRGYGRLIDKITDLNQTLSQKNLELEERVMERTLELHNEQEKLFVTLRSIGDGVITTDTAGVVTFINVIAEKLTGWLQQEAIDQPLTTVFNIINEKTGRPCINPVDNVLASGKIIGLANHTALIAKDGTHKSIADSAAPILGPEGEIIGVVLVFRDITQEKKTEEELLKIKKLESVGVLAGGIAHDFNNILMAILGNISVAGKHIDPENKAYSLLQEAEKASMRAKDLTQQLLTFSKGGDPVRKTTSIKQIITDSADFVLHGSRTACHFDIPEDLWLVDIDSGQISQVIQNIVLNARHAMPEGGDITITCTNISDITTETGLSLPNNKYIKMTIVDNGGGIPEKYLDKVFDPYFSTKQEGSGLGLAITHSIINKHEGHIFVESKAGEGTIFTIYLPCSDKQITHQQSKEHQQKAKETSKARILVMDDEPLILDVAEHMLGHLGHEVLLAEDGRKAIEIFNESRQSGKPVDLIIMDLTIPGGMGGRDAVREILKIDPEATVVVSSGYSNDPVMADFKKYGFKAAIGKPFELAELKETINSILT